MVGMAVRKHHRVDVFRLDAGFRHALLLAPGGRAKALRRAEAVSNSTSLSPMFTIGEFCSSTMLVGDRKLSLSIFRISSSGTPVKVPLGSPSDSGPSDTTVTSAPPKLNRCQ